MITYALMHFYNEELLIRDWIEHHLKIFDYLILVDHRSTDSSVDIIKSFNCDRILKCVSNLEDFNATANDREIESIESTYIPNGKSIWKMCLNTTEFIFTPNLKNKLYELHNQYPDIQAFGMKSVCLVDKEPAELQRPIWKNRNWGFVDNGSVRRWRYIHNAKHGHYQVGRHGTDLSAVNIPELLILHFSYSPYPQCKKRKLQIQNRIPQSDKNAGLGKEHLVTEKQLDRNRFDALQYSYDLFENPIYSQYYQELLNENNN